MSKQLQTIYVPTHIDLATEYPLSIPVISLGGMVSQQFNFDLKHLREGYRELNKQQSYLYTPEEHAQVEKMRKALELLARDGGYSGASYIAQEALKQ